LAVGPGSGSSRAKRVEVLNDFLSENVGIGKIVGFFEALVCEPDDIEASLVGVNKFLVLVAGGDRPL